MITPTRAQTRVLKAVQNRSLAITALLADAENLEGTPTPQWFSTYQHHALARADLIAAATAGGVPRAWLDQAQARGERGIAWRADLYLAAPDPTDWDRILGDLTTDVARIQEWEALDAANQRLHAHDPGEASASLRTNLSALHMRTAGVANLLGVTAEQGIQLWGELDDWARSAAATLHGLPTEQIPHRRQAAAATDTRAWIGQATALATDARVAVDAGPALPAPEALRIAIAEEIGPVHALFVTAGGTEIGAALEAAIPQHDPRSTSTTVLFSDAPEAEEPQPSEHLAAEPVFLSAQDSPW
ncbi:hypothetical protein ACTD5D_09975 [Nocardia takedensis]|uniref:hypothetical protein n=1 Tax=Nocardia takedensis TaxID=259390 RepID=UPI003F774466